MFIYCKKCSKKTEYKYKKPEKCVFCNYLFSSVSPVTLRNKATSNVFSVSSRDSRPSQEEDDFSEVDLIDDDWFYDKNYRPGRFKSFIDASSTERRKGFSVEIDKGNSIKMGDLLRNLGEIQEGG